MNLSPYVQLKTWLAVAATAVVIVAAGPAAAQADYPNKPVKMLIGFPPGQATDVLGRAVAVKLSQQLGQQFVVENKPGAAGIIATQTAMSAPADGYNLLVSSSGPLAVNPGLYSKLPYDPVKDFVPVAGIATVPLLLVVNPNFPPKTVKELVAHAKAKPKAVNYASGGSGVTNHLVMEMFRGASGIELTHVPYKGGPPAVTDLIGGQVDVMFETAPAVLGFVKQGKLRALGVSSAQRISAVPDLPTVAEQGYPGFSGVPWIALMAPANTPPAIVAKLNAEVNKALATKELRDQFAALGAEPMVMTQAELGGYIKSEIAKWTKAVKDSGAKVE